MYQILYLCNYRPHWYDDVPPVGNLQQAAQLCDHIATQRRCYAKVIDGYGNTVYQTDRRGILGGIAALFG